MENKAFKKLDWNLKHCCDVASNMFLKKISKKNTKRFHQLILNMHHFMKWRMMIRVYIKDRLIVTRYGEDGFIICR